MAEYIEREALIKRLGVTPILKYGIPTYTRDGVIDLVEKQPAADVVPVVHGRWIDRSDKGVISLTHPYVCNRCGRVEMLKEPYCNCGARMDGESK